MTKPLLSDPKQVPLLLIFAMQADTPISNEDNRNAHRKELNYQFEYAKQQSKNQRLKEKNQTYLKPIHFGKSSTPIHKNRKS